MKRMVYVETRVLSYLTARPSRDIVVAAHQEATRELWSRMAKDYDVYVSALVFNEAGRGDRDQTGR